MRVCFRCCHVGLGGGGGHSVVVGDERVACLITYSLVQLLACSDIYMQDGFQGFVACAGLPTVTGVVWAACCISMHCVELCGPRIPLQRKLPDQAKS